MASPKGRPIGYSTIRKEHVNKRHPRTSIGIDDRDAVLRLKFSNTILKMYECAIVFTMLSRL
jgi:hypothetical protein